MAKEKVMVAGHICLDITPVFPDKMTGSFADILAPGKLVNVDNAVLGTGGAVSNTGGTMLKLGLDAILNGKVGKDSFGELIKSIVGAENTKSFREVAGQSSSYSVVLALPGIDRVFLHHTGTNDTFTSDDIDYETLKECCLFHFGYPTLMRQMFLNKGHELIEMYRRAKECSVITSLDMTVPDPVSESGQVDWREILVKTLPYVDVFLPSVEEIAYMLNRDLFEQRKKQADGNDPVLAYAADDFALLAGELIGMGVKIAAIKAGINGYYLQTASANKWDTLGKQIDLNQWSQRQLWAPSYHIEQVASATGAGDATIAGFLTAIIRDLEPIRALKAANCLGWQNVREFDSLSGIEDWQATLDYIDQPDKPVNPLAQIDAQWQYSKENKIYFGPLDSILTKAK